MIFRTILIILIVALGYLHNLDIKAQEINERGNNNIINNLGERISSPSSEASESVALKEASSTTLVKKVVEKTPDITESKPEVKGKLEKILEENSVRELSVFNFIRYGIRYAVEQGVPANTLVLILLFPLVATLVVFSRHIIGLKSFGIFTPALLSVTFLNTGLAVGVALFILILFVASMVRMLLKRIRIQYLPRMALYMWAVSMSIFGVLLISPSLGREELITIGIFPILILILLSEDYLDLQITRSFSQAIMVTIETLIVAIIGYFLMNMEFFQRLALVHAEILTVGMLIIISLIERYDGLRLLEIWRFKKIITTIK
jgi:hypothetical protein